VEAVKKPVVTKANNRNNPPNRAVITNKTVELT
jgi:hypothetical protein